jgi:hypothetical protein
MGKTYLSSVSLALGLFRKKSLRPPSLFQIWSGSAAGLAKK